jgi:hypothetical protein
VLAAAHLARLGQPALGKLDRRMARQQVTGLSLDLHGVEVGGMEPARAVDRYAPVLLPARAAEDHRVGGPLALLLGADRAAALAPVVEVRRVSVQAGGDTPALGEEGVEFDAGGWLLAA